MTNYLLPSPLVFHTIQVLTWFKYYLIPNERQNTAIKTRPLTLDEARHGTTETRNSEQPSSGDDRDFAHLALTVIEVSPVGHCIN
jgi:hypothetical protein